MSAIANLVETEGAVERIINSGGVELACDSILSNSSGSKVNTINSLTVLEKIIDNDNANVNSLIDKGANDAIVMAMKNSGTSLKGEEVQIKSLAVCEKMIHGNDSA